MKVAMMINAKTALLAGKNSHGWQIVDIDPGHLPEELRAVLAKYPRNNSSYSRDPDAPFVLHTTNQAEGTQESLIAELSLRIAKQKAQEEEERRCEEEEVQRLLTAPIGELVRREDNCGVWSWDIGYHLDRNKDPRLETRKAEAKAECERLNVVEQKKAREEQEQRRIAAEQEVEKKRLREEAEEKRRDILRTWALANGSELLKERIAGNYEWEGLAQQEFTDQVCAGISLERIEDEEGEVQDRTTPTLEEIQALKEVKKALEGKPASARLVWVTYEDEVDDDYSPGPCHRTEIEVVVETPDQEAEVRYYKM